MKIKYILIFVSIALSFNSYASDTRGISIGGSFGNISYDSSGSDIMLDKSDSTYSVIGQLRINSGIGIEATFGNFGEYESSLSTTQYSGLTASFVGNTDKYYGIQAFGKAGIGILTMTQRIQVFGVEVENKSVGDMLLASGGLAYTIKSLPQLTLRVSYDYYYFRTAGVVSGSEKNNNLTATSIGVLLNF